MLRVRGGFELSSSLPDQLSDFDGEVVASQYAYDDSDRRVDLAETVNEQRFFDAL